MPQVRLLKNPKTNTLPACLPSWEWIQRPLMLLPLHSLLAIFFFLTSFLFRLVKKMLESIGVLGILLQTPVDANWTGAMKLPFLPIKHQCRHMKLISLILSYRWHIRIQAIEIQKFETLGIIEWVVKAHNFLQLLSKCSLSSTR